MPVRQVACVPPGPLRTAAVALQAVGPLTLLGADSRLGRRDAAAVRAALTAPAAHPRAALRPLAWALPSGRALCPAVGTAAVSQLTAILTKDVTAARRAAHLAYVRAATGRPAMPAASEEFKGFVRTLPHAWRLQCDNRVKEALWRLAVDAQPGARVAAWRCPCTAGGPPASAGRLHSHWDCPVAQAVRGQLMTAELPCGPLPQAPSRAHVWLLRPPGDKIADGPWALVALAAVAAMEFGRRVLWAQAHAGVAREEAVAAAGNRAAEWFCAALRDFRSAPDAATSDGGGGRREGGGVSGGMEWGGLCCVPSVSASWLRP
jgi:hypothetical protein